MVLPEDKSPPILEVSNKVWTELAWIYFIVSIFWQNRGYSNSICGCHFQNGFVDENSPVGTKVVDAEGNEISFKVTDADHDIKVSWNCQFVSYYNVNHFIKPSNIWYVIYHSCRPKNWRWINTH